MKFEEFKYIKTKSNEELLEGQNGESTEERVNWFLELIIIYMYFLFYFK